MKLVWISATCLIVLTASAAAQFRPVALVGDDVPGQPGIKLDRVSEVAPLGGNLAVYRGRTSESDDIIAIDDGSGSDSTIAVRFAAAPGGGTFDVMSALTAAGSNFAFQALVGGQQTIFAWSAATGLRRVIGQGDVLPSTRTLGPIVSFVINPLGQVLITGSDEVLVEPNGTVRSILHLGGPVPGDTGYTVTAVDHPMGRIWLSDTGDLTLGSLGSTGTLTRSYVLHGPPGTVTVARSTASLPNQSGDVAAMAASKTGLIAFSEVYSTDAAGPTVEHFVIKTGAAGSEIEALHLMDATTFTVDGHIINTGSLRHGQLDPTVGLFVRTSNGIIRHSAGAWSSIHFDDEILPGEAGARPAEIAALGGGGQLLLIAGTGAATSIYVWTTGSGIQKLVQTYEMVPGPGGTPGRINALALGATPISDDGRVAFIAGIDMPTVAVGAYLTGGSAGLTTDLALTGADPAIRSTETVGTLGVLIENRGPSAAAVDLMISGSNIRRITRCTAKNGANCSCQGELCSISPPIEAGESVEMSFLLDIDSEDVSVHFEVSTQTAQELNAEDNVLEVTIRGYGPPSNGCGCAAQSDVSMLFVALSLSGILLRPCRRRCKR